MEGQIYVHHLQEFDQDIKMKRKTLRTLERELSYYLNTHCISSHKLPADKWSNKIEGQTLCYPPPVTSWIDSALHIFRVPTSGSVKINRTVNYSCSIVFTFGFIPAQPWQHNLAMWTQRNRCRSTPYKECFPAKEFYSDNINCIR